MKLLILAVASSWLVGCTDAEWDSLVASYGESHKVDCYSGGRAIFQVKTTGKVYSLPGGGWAFRTTENKFVKTFADCFVWYQK